MRLTLIAAVAENGVIGRGGQLPWRLSSDLQRFKRLTLGHHLIMGRRTFESIGRALPGRTTIVLSRGGGCAALTSNDGTDGLKMKEPDAKFLKRVENDPFPRAEAAPAARR